MIRAGAAARPPGAVRRKVWELAKGSPASQLRQAVQERCRPWTAWS